MYNTGSLYSSNAGKVALAVVKKSIHESAVGIPRRGVNHQTCWFVNDDEILILVEDIEGNILRNDLGGLRLWKADCDLVTRVDGSFRLCFRSVDHNVPLLEESLDAGAREIRKFPHKKQIESFAAGCFDLDRHGSRLEQEETRGK